jgi:hypothetical protein
MAAERGHPARVCIGETRVARDFDPEIKLKTFGRGRAGDAVQRSPVAGFVDNHGDAVKSFLLERSHRGRG